MSEFRSLVGDFEGAGIFESVEEASSGPADEACTAENWKKFLPYLRFDARQGRDLVASLPVQISKPRNPIQLYHGNGPVTIEIYSERLQEIFLDAVDVSCYPGISVFTTCISIDSPYVVFFHELGRLREMVNQDSSAAEEDKQHFEALYYYLTLDVPATNFKDIKRLLDRGIILYTSIWALFSSKSLLVSLDHLRNWEVSKVLAVAWEEDNVPTSYARRRWFITTSSIIKVGGKYQILIRKRRLEEFQGVKQIRHLDFFPIEYLEEHEVFRATAIERGKRWRQFCEGEPTVMSYEGQALSLLRVMDMVINADGTTIFSPVYV